MTDEKLEKEAGNWLRQYLLCCNCEKKCNCIDSNSYCEEEVLKSYLAGAEPREKRIAELEKENAELKAQIEKMKCCGNCAKYNSGYGESPCKLFASGICGEWETSIGKF